MGYDGDTRTKRVELADGNWAEVRTRLTVGDVRHQRMEAQSRGFADETLDSLGLIPRLVEKWSFGDVTQATVDELAVNDALAIVGAINDVLLDRPNPSSPSSAGTGEGAAKVRVRRANGSSD